MKGYKAFDKDLKCRDFQYEIGKEYEITGTLLMCENGFHFCKTIGECYIYYPKDNNTRICEIEAIGETVEGDGKCCTSKIRIVRELTKEEHNNGNVGDNNIGYSNKGNSNKGDSNEGDSNEGDYNKGNYNKGYSNKGNSNKGYSNKGDYNEGNYNIGIRNKGNYQVGICNTNAPLVIFNKVSKMTLEDLINSGAYDDILNGKLTDEVRAIDTFDEAIWKEIYEVEEE